MWLRRLARAGLAARGFVYCTVGYLAAQRALGNGGDTVGPEGAVRHVGRGTLGDVLLVAIAAGLIGYGVWRCIQGLHDTEGKGSDARGLAVRALYLGKGLLHFGLAVTPLRVLRDQPGEGNDVRSWTAQALQHEAGPWVVGALGAAVIVGGGYQAWKGFKKKFAKNLMDGELSARTRAWAYRTGTVGFAARGVTLAIMGFFLTTAAREANPGEAKGLGETLAMLLQQPYGRWLLGVVAAGLVAYGVYSFVEARFRRIAT
jgi:hypothetical protein